MTKWFFLVVLFLLYIELDQKWQTYMVLLRRSALRDKEPPVSVIFVETEESAWDLLLRPRSPPGISC
jgi:hypothetical protein